MKKEIVLINGFLSLLVGSIIYILFRTNHLKMFSWFEYMGLIDTINNIRNQTSNYHLYDWFLFSLPDGLWLFSYVSLMLFIWKGEIMLKNILWISIVPTIALASEIGQSLNIIPGTYDVNDMIMYIIGAILPLIIYNKSLTINLNQT